MTTATHPQSLTIRPARPEDAQALRDLAQLDSRRLPAGELLVGEVDGRPLAAIDVVTREVVADPFVPTRELVALLAARADALRATRLGRTQRARARLELWSAVLHRLSAARPSV
jgi:hypothetical protein